MSVPRPWTSGLKRILPRPSHSVRRWCRGIASRDTPTGFFLRLSGRRKERLYSGRTDSSAFRPARPRFAPPPHHAPPRTGPPVIYQSVPGHVLHEKCLRGQIGDGTLVSSKERRAAVVPRIKRLSTADKVVINRLSTAGLVPTSVYIGCPLFVLPKSRCGSLSNFTPVRFGLVGLLTSSGGVRPPRIYCPRELHLGSHRILFEL